MNQNQHFDNNIKSQFEDYAPQVQPHVWENIINERKKRRPVGFWFRFFNKRNIILLTALLIMVAGGIYFGVQNKNVPQQSVTVSGLASKPGNKISELEKKVAEKGKDIPGADNYQIKNSVQKEVKVADQLPNILSKKNKSANSINQLEAAGVVYNFTDKKIASDDIKTEIARNTGQSENKVNNELELRKLFFYEEAKIKSGILLGNLKNNPMPKIFLPDCPSIEKDAAGNKTYLEFYGGPDYGLRNISDTGNSVYLQKRKQSTSFASAFSAGARITKVFDNGMSIRTGINYSQINEKFSFVQGNLVQITYIIDANGDTTGSYITTGTRYKTTINRYRTIDVPLLVGYEMGNGKLHANINAGVLVNAYSWQKGDVLDSTLQPISITTGKSSSAYQFRTNIGVGFMGAISFYYKLNDKIHLMAEPYFRYNLTPMSSEILTIRQKYNTAGLHLGIRMDLH